MTLREWRDRPMGLLARMRLFLGIVWRPWYGGRMGVRTAWAVAFAGWRQ